LSVSDFCRKFLRIENARFKETISNENDFKSFDARNFTDGFHRRDFRARPAG